jgi:hypothetical protein
MKATVQLTRAETQRLRQLYREHRRAERAYVDYARALMKRYDLPGKSSVNFNTRIVTVPEAE